MANWFSPGCWKLFSPNLKLIGAEFNGWLLKFTGATEGLVMGEEFGDGCPVGLMEGDVCLDVGWLIARGTSSLGFIRGRISLSCLLKNGIREDFERRNTINF